MRTLLLPLLLLAALCDLRAQTEIIYTDALGPGWQNWSWLGTYTFNNSSPVRSGTASIRCQQSGWGGLSLRHDPIASNAYAYLEFYIHGGTTGGQLLDVFLENDTSQPCSGVVNLEDFIVGGGGVVSGAWRLVSIPLTALPVTRATYTRVDIRNRTGNAYNYYLDDIKLTQTSSAPPFLTSVRMGGDRQVVAFFDTGLTAASATNPAHYELHSTGHPYYNTRRPATAAHYDASRRRVTLTFPTNFVAGARYTLFVNNLTNLAGIAIAPDSTGTFAFSNQTLTVNATAGNHPIRPLIYGVAWAPSTNALREIGATVHRWGGNHTSTYNFQIHAKNTGNDWYFQNEPWQTSPTFTPVAHAIEFGQWNQATAVAGLLTVPALPFIAKNTNANSFSVAQYGPQQAVAPDDPDAGNGIGTNGLPIVNNPLDSGTTNSAALQSQWLAGLAASNVAPAFVAIDNEMDIWNSTHRDWHPAPTTYDEMWQVFTNYATMVRAVLPAAQICAPVSCCWWYYWNSEAGPADKAAHGGVDFLEWFLDQARARDLQTGQRLLDVLDIHYYPDSFWNNGADPAQQLRSTRELWDPTYRHEGWIGTDQWATQTQPNRNYPQLIPRLRQLIADHYPGTKLGLTEYNWGADHTLPGALALADCLGIFGREQLDLACYWTFPPLPARLAFQLYRNYDGQQSAFGDIAAAVTGGNPDFLTAYAALETGTGALTLVVVNKNPDFDYRVTLTLTNFLAAPTATVYQVSAADLKAVRSEPPVTNTTDWVFPAYSATLVRLPVADSDADGLPDLWELTWSGSVTGLVPGADNDGDGFTNEQEYRAGTIPTDPTSALRFVAPPVNGALSFTSVAGKSYAVERCDDLAAPDCWNAWTNVTGTGGVIHIADPAAAGTPQRFYRVRLLP